MLLRMVNSAMVTIPISQERCCGGSEDNKDRSYNQIQIINLRNISDIMKIILQNHLKLFQQLYQLQKILKLFVIKMNKILILNH